MRKPRHIGQKFAFATAVFCAFMMLPTLGAFFWSLQAEGIADTWTPSILTTVAFFGFCAVVLYVMSIPQPVLPAEDASVNG